MKVDCKKCPIAGLCVFSGHYADQATEQCPLLRMKLLLSDCCYKREYEAEFLEEGDEKC